MAAINFPNPGTQTPPNTFSPSSSPAKTVNGLTYVWNGVGWRIRSTQGEGGGTKVIISETAPGDAFAGDLWWDSGEPASLFIYYIDNDSKQWVPATPVTSGWYVNGGQLTTSQSGIEVNVGGTIVAGTDAYAGNSLFAKNNSATNPTVFARNYSGGPAFAGYGVDATPTVTISGDGSITAAGRIDANNGVTVDGGSSLSTGIYYRDDSTSYGLALYSGGSKEIHRRAFIKTDGSALFESTVRANNTGSNPCFQAGTNSVVNTSIRADGTAEFSGDITSGGNILTRSSGNMNVGDELENAKNALTSIKAAATDANTDLAGLKAAIVAALANH